MSTRFTREYSRVLVTREWMFPYSRLVLYNFYFKAVHVPGHSNDIADSISRFQQTRFRRLAPHADQQPQPLPEELFRL